MPDLPTDPRLIESQLGLNDLESAKLRIEIERAKIGLRQDERYTRQMEAKADNHNVYTFWGSVTGMSASAVVAALDEWSRRAPGAELTFRINSPGGSVLDGLAIYDYLQDLKRRGHKVTTLNLGMAASMGGVLLQAGSERVAGANSFMLIHEVSSGAMGKMTELEDEIKFAKRLQERLIAILAERSTLTERQIKTRWERKDWWLGAEEALEHGFVDRIQ